LDATEITATEVLMTEMQKKTPSYDLSARRVAILATNGFEESELKSPLAALKAAG
jgi:putative intracellular protease/amidase